MADIRESIDRIAQWTASHPHDEVYQAAVLRELGVIGEAASALSDSFRAAHPEIPWREVIGQRVQLVHRYWDTEWARVARTVAEDLPRLREALSGL